MATYNLNLVRRDIDQLNGLFGSSPYSVRLDTRRKYLVGERSQLSVVALHIYKEPWTFMGYDLNQVTVFHGLMDDFPLDMQADIKTRMGKVAALDDVVKWTKPRVKM
ncbi:hypothetical protein HYV86_03060 [Candidatus Woesearchaeota archaeon]|nr:hypothetical protein [Candidatus Woesearchaeota archaeon]